MDKIQRATEIHRSMTPHQMALRIVELQDALELAEEAVLAKQPPVAPDGWKLVPVNVTLPMQHAYFGVIDKNMQRVETDCRFGRYDSAKEAYRAMLSAAPKLGGE